MTRAPLCAGGELRAALARDDAVCAGLQVEQEKAEKND